MPEQYLLAIDNGTQSVRALLFDARGNLVGKGKQEINPYFSEQPGWAEQHPECFWQAVQQACAQLWQSTDIDRRHIAGVSVTTQRGTVINLDRDGKPLRPAIIWLDQRHADVSAPVPGIWRWLFKLAGVDDIIQRFREKSQAIWLQQQQPDIWANTDKFLLLSGYLNFKLTDRFVDSVASQVGYIPFDYKRQRWAKAADWRWRLLPIKPAMLPTLCQPGELLGQVTAEAAAFTGIPAGTPVFASASDKACEILGCGGHQAHIGCLSYGTTATISTTNDRYREPIAHLPAYPAAIPGKFNSEIMIYRGFWMVSWFKQEFGLREQKIAAQKGVAPEALFDELVNAVPAGSMGLMLQPYWSPGIRQPGPEAKGSIIGFSDVHTRAHIYRAILEGLAYALREGKEQLEKRSGRKITEIRVSGGGSQSDAAMQLTADIFGLPAQRPHTYETSGLGAAIHVAVGLGIYPDFDTAIQAMTRVGRHFTPDPKTATVYEQLYREVYLKMYRQLQPLYRSIRAITGYPK